MSKLILTRGVPASGKSTFAKAWVAESPETRRRVNRDNLRWTLGIKTGVGDHKQEEEVTYWQHNMIRKFLKEGHDVVVDDTNLRSATVRKLLFLASDENADVEYVDFPIDFQTAVQRDSTRKMNGERSVGTDVLKSFFAKFIKNDDQLPPLPTLEGKTLPLNGFKVVEFDPSLPHAVLVDIDGTIAHMDGLRGPYDEHLYHVDRYDALVDMIADLWVDETGARKILMSGRNETGRDNTEGWLLEKDVFFDEFYMRAEGDNRNDAIVKNELYEQHIAGRYNVDFVLDDRNQVVKMWRAKGLKVLHVADGDF